MPWEKQQAIEKMQKQMLERLLKQLKRKLFVKFTKKKMFLPIPLHPMWEAIPKDFLGFWNRRKSLQGSSFLCEFCKKNEVADLFLLQQEFSFSSTC